MREGASPRAGGTRRTVVWSRQDFQFRAALNMCAKHDVCVLEYPELRSTCGYNDHQPLSNSGPLRLPKYLLPALHLRTGGSPNSMFPIPSFCSIFLALRPIESFIDIYSLSVPREYVEVVQNGTPNRRAPEAVGAPGPEEHVDVRVHARHQSKERAKSRGTRDCCYCPCPTLCHLLTFTTVRQRIVIGRQHMELDLTAWLDAGELK